MVIVNFHARDVKDIAEKLLVKLFEKSEGDEWEEILLIDVYSKEVTGSYDKDNEHLKNNVLQYLISHELANYNQDAKSLSILPKGKDWIFSYKVEK